ncbi:hypothetical protein AMAG_04653 [Allomyces macrogynus ATCC 38327]|uniref:Uncharacterized protein n=1 Tax=Allomyces macrogynus (strain ATCC 38327) TaxID=578462 RepID=A0A0L0S5W3_ALLM3|nr:hypothetical protein AMAG_04653 [Allomyces macrogynus ATCC 38327]|eukprot:KNE57806.1 hypothetical protein AMAG_04653 [Allomyces macrogynus ATCC 38327]
MGWLSDHHLLDFRFTLAPAGPNTTHNLAHSAHWTTIRPSGTVAAHSAHFENLTAHSHVYRDVSRYDRSWTRRVRKRAFDEIWNQIAWLLQHGQKGLTADELECGEFVGPPVAKEERSRRSAAAEQSQYTHRGCRV